MHVVPGNFFNGQGVYVIAEYRAPETTFDVEFGFLPNVLESLVDVRCVQRAPSASDSGGAGATSSPRTVLQAVAQRMGWVTLAPLPLGSPLDASFRCP